VAVVVAAASLHSLFYVTSIVTTMSNWNNNGREAVSHSDLFWPQRLTSINSIWPGN